MAASTVAYRHDPMMGASSGAAESDSYNDWRLRVESNEERGWRTVPAEYSDDHKAYMIGGQYDSDLKLKTDEIFCYARGVEPLGEGKDAWIFDVDDTCISNVLYYQRKDYGCKPFDSAEFKDWILRGECPAIPEVLKLFKYLIGRKFQVFLITGRRDEEVIRKATIENLQKQGFIGYERLIFRPEDSRRYTRGQDAMKYSAVKYKSEIRKQIHQEGYTIWGVVGDQWSDVQGEFLGKRTFKLPNPMYYV